MRRCTHNDGTRRYATPLAGHGLRLDTVCQTCGDTLWSDAHFSTHETPAAESARDGNTTTLTTPGGHTL